MQERTVFDHKGIAAVVALLLFFCGPAAAKAKDAVTIAMEPTAVNTLIYLAQELGYFAQHDLDIVIDDSYPSGVAATREMLAGKVDLATTTESAIVRYAFTGEAIRTLGSIDRFMHMKLVAHRSRGIETVKDLAGKRIGVPVNTAADFKLGRFLDLHGIDKKDIGIVDVQAPQAVEALAGGGVDAVVTWQPHVIDIEKRLGGKAVVFDVQSEQPLNCLLVARPGWAEGLDVKERLMKALLQAEHSVQMNEEEAQRIMQKRLQPHYGDAYIPAIWGDHHFALGIGQPLILAMEDQARWMIANGLAPGKEVPDFVDFLDTAAMEAVKPQAVSIIR